MAFSSMFKRMGTKQTKMIFSIEIISVSLPLIRGLAPGDLLHVSFERGNKSKETQEYAVGECDGPMGQMETIMNETLSLEASIYKDASGTAQEKTGTLTVKQRKSGVSGKKNNKDAFKTVGVVPLELQELVNANGEEMTFPLAWCVAEGATLTAKITAKTADDIEDDNSSISTSGTMKGKTSHTVKKENQMKEPSKVQPKTDLVEKEKTKDDIKGKVEKNKPEKGKTKTPEKDSKSKNGKRAKASDDEGSFSNEETPVVNKAIQPVTAVVDDWQPNFADMNTDSVNNNGFENNFGEAKISDTSVDWGGDPFENNPPVVKQNSAVVANNAKNVKSPTNDDPFSDSFGGKSTTVPPSSSSSNLSGATVPAVVSPTVTIPAITADRTKETKDDKTNILSPMTSTGSPATTIADEYISPSERISRAKAAAQVGAATMVAKKDAQAQQSKQSKQAIAWQKEIADLKIENDLLKEKGDAIEIMTMKADFFAKEAARLDEALAVVMKEREIALARKAEAETELAKREVENSALLEELLAAKTSVVELTTELENVREQTANIRKRSEQLMAKLNSLEVMMAESSLNNGLPASASHDQLSGMNNSNNGQFYSNSSNASTDSINSRRSGAESGFNNFSSNESNSGIQNPFTKMATSKLAMSATAAFAGATSALRSNDNNTTSASVNNNSSTTSRPINFNNTTNDPFGGISRRSSSQTPTGHSESNTPSNMADSRLQPVQRTRHPGSGFSTTIL